MELKDFEVSAEERIEQLIKERMFAKHLIWLYLWFKEHDILYPKEFANSQKITMSRSRQVLTHFSHLDLLKKIGGEKRIISEYRLPEKSNPLKRWVDKAKKTLGLD